MESVREYIIKVLITRKIFCHRARYWILATYCPGCSELLWPEQNRTLIRQVMVGRFLIPKEGPGDGAEEAPHLLVLDGHIGHHCEEACCWRG